MQHIDAIEGVVKSILSEMFHASAVDSPDDTDYIRSVKIIIRASVDHVQNFTDSAGASTAIQNALYSHAKNLWLNHIKKIRQSEPDACKSSEENQDGYDSYFFDYIYKHDSYPP